MVDASIGHYKIIRKIAEGNVGDVFEAVDLARDRRAVIKALRPELPKRPELLQRFDSEVQTLALLIHPNIATVFGFIHEAERLYLAMEFVEGETLQAILQRNGRVEPTIALSFFQQILRAVGFAHRIGLIHGDLKPSNIMVTSSGVIKVLDFGIASIFGRPRKTRAGYLVGTLQYLSPEQIRGEPVDARSDIYSLGILLYELIVGHAPFDSDSDYELMHAQIEATPLPPSAFVRDIPEWIDAFFRRALAKSRSNRFQSITEMAGALGLKVEANEPTVWTEQAAVWLQDTRDRMLSVAHSVWMTGKDAFGSLSAALAITVEMSRKHYASATRAGARTIEAMNPIAWTKQTAVPLLRAARWFSITVNSTLLLGNRVFVSLRGSLAGAMEVSRNYYALLARTIGRAIEMGNQNVWRERAAVGLQRTGSWTRSVSDSILTTTNRLFESLRLTLEASEINWKRYALLPLVLIALTLQVVLFSGDDTELGPDDKNAQTALTVPEVRLAEANKVPIAASPPHTKNQRPAKAVKPVSKNATTSSKELRNRQVSKNQPEPLKTPATELAQLPAASGSARQTDQVPVKEPSRTEPNLSERNAENKVTNIRLNIKWEN